MSILKFENRTPRSLLDMYNYLTDVNKTDVSTIFGIGVNPLFAVQEMNFLQQIYYQNKLLHPYIQIIFSFDININLDIEMIKEICIKIGAILTVDNRQILGAIHYKDTNKIHCHYMINYVGIDGSLYRQIYFVTYYKKLVNQILEEYNLNPIVLNKVEMPFYINA